MAPEHKVNLNSVFFPLLHKQMNHIEYIQTVYCTVLYCTALYCTVLHCTAM